MESAFVWIQQKELSFPGLFLSALVAGNHFSSDILRAGTVLETAGIKCDETYSSVQRDGNAQYYVAGHAEEILPAILYNFRGSLHTTVNASRNGHIMASKKPRGTWKGG